MPPAIERRRAPRSPANLKSTCMPVGNELTDKPWPARVEDISAGGIKVSVCRRFERGTRLIVEMENRAERVSRTIVACVVHLKENPAGGWYLGCSIDGELDAKTVDSLRLKTEELSERFWMRMPVSTRTTCYVSGSEDGPLRKVRVENVSRGGIGLEVTQPVPEGACLEVQVPSARSALHRVLARVIRATPRGNQRWFLGCAFFAELSEREVEAFVNPSGADYFRLEKDYTLLFNGKDLTGWELGHPPQHDKPNDERLHGKTASKQRFFEVNDNNLTASGKGPRVVYTAQEYNKPFHLKLECRPPADHASNHSSLIVRGAELQLHAAAQNGSANGKSSVAHLREGVWNEIDVTVRPAVVLCTVNGQPLDPKDVLGVLVSNGKPTATLNGEPIKLWSLQCTEGAEAICKCNGAPIGPPLAVAATGAIGLLSGAGKFDFRRIRIKEMP